MKGLVKALRFSPDGSRLAAVSEEDGLVCLARKWRGWGAEWRIERIPGWSVAWSAEGSRILVGDKEGMSHIVNLLSGESKTLPVKHRKSVFTVAWSHDDSLLATAGWDNELHIISTQELTVRSKLEADWGSGFDYSGPPIAFSPDGQYIAWAASAKLVRVSSVEGLPAGEMEAQSTVLALAWSPDSRHLWVADSGAASGLHPHCYSVEHCVPRSWKGP
jgi:WD40 repeat protein